MTRPDGAVFRGEARVEHADRAQVGWMIARHYLRKWPAIVRCILGMWTDRGAVGVVVFADAPRETSVRYGCPTWELARLWVDDAVPTNAESWLIAAAVRHVSTVHAEVGMLVSYADPSRGHSGTIYRASNWTADGMTDDERKSPRFDYAPVTAAGLLDGSAIGAAVGRRGHLGADVARVPRVSKHRFFLRLNRRSDRAAPSLWTDMEPDQRAEARLA